MDETPVWDDMVSTTTVDNVGASSINLKTTGHEKVMVTVCLSARADGTKLKPYIVFRGAKREVKRLNEDFKHKCVIATSANAWMNEELTLKEEDIAGWEGEGTASFQVGKKRTRRMFSQILTGGVLRCDMGS